ncbi:MAG: ADOP family duplicated permease, partial [Pseudomonadales bacterium]|nr:ADOP family duplicated permease [Pseudomonadales bacterium]
MSGFMYDIAFAWRSACKRPGTAILIVLTLAFGIGVNTAMVSTLFQVTLGSLPYANGAHLVKLEQTVPIKGRGDGNWSISTREDVRAQTTVFSGIASYSQLPYAIQGPRGPVQGMGAAVSWNFFTLFGVRPLLGRGFAPGDDVAGAAPVVLLSYEFWNREYGGDPAAVGGTVEIMDVLYQVIGVLPRLPPFPDANAIWIPETTDPYRAFSPGVQGDRKAAALQAVFALRHADASLPATEAELNAVAQRLKAAYPDHYPEDYGIAAQPLRTVLVAAARPALALMAGLSFLVLAIAAANIASLMLGRTLTRNQELAIREAIGASPVMILRQLVAESVLFALLGGVAALAVAYACLRLLRNFAAGFTPLASEIHMSGAVPLFVLGTVVALGGCIGILPALTKRDINRCLKEGGDKVTTSSSGVRKRRALLLTQYVLAFVMLTSSALIIASLYRLYQQDAGYDAARILAVNLPLSFQPDDDWRVAAGDFSRQLLSETRAVPGVNGAAVFSGQPLLQRVAYLSALLPFSIEGEIFADDAAPAALRRSVSEGFFTLLNIPLLRGRDFAAADDEQAQPVAIISESLARRYFPASDALGQHIRFAYGGAWLTIVGVAADIRSQGLDSAEPAAIYLSYWQNYNESLSLYVKGAGDPAVLTRALTTIVHDLNPRQPVERAVTLDTLKSEWLAPARLRAIAITVFGALALIVTFSGVIGVVSYNVNARRREIGIHLAAGATPGNILRLFLVDGLRIYAMGLLLGLALMLVLAPLLAPLLYQTAALDGVVYLLSMLALTLV